VTPRYSARRNNRRALHETCRLARH
jgi:hypothetical protein